MTQLSVRRGKDAAFQITAYDADGQLADLTVDHLWFTAKTSVDLADNAASIQKQTGAGITIDGLGLATVALVPADTRDLPGPQALVLFWDLQSFDSDDKATILASGTLHVLAVVTRVSAP